MVYTSYEPGGVFLCTYGFMMLTCAFCCKTLKLTLTSLRFMVEGVISKLTNGGRKVTAKLFYLIVLLHLIRMIRGIITLYCSGSIENDIFLANIEYLTLYPQIAM